MRQWCQYPEFEHTTRINQLESLEVYENKKTMDSATEDTTATTMEIKQSGVIITNTSSDEESDQAKVEPIGKDKTTFSINKAIAA